MLYKWLLFKLSDRKKNDFKIKNPDLSSLEWKNQILFSACGKLFSYFIVMYETYDKIWYDVREHWWTRLQDDGENLHFILRASSSESGAQR